MFSTPHPLRASMGAFVVTVVAVGLGLAFMQALQSSTTMAVFIPAALLVALLWSRMAEHHVPVLLIAIFALMPFSQSVAGPSSPLNISASDVLALLLSLTLPVVLLRRGRLQCGPVGLPLFIFFSVVTISSVVFWDGLNTAASLFRMYVVIVLSVMIFANATLQIPMIYRCFGAYLLGVSVLGCFNFLAFLQGGYLNSEGTLGINKNALGPTYGCGIVIALGCLLSGTIPPRLRPWLITALSISGIGLLLSLSRGGWIATGGGILLLLLLTRNLKTFMISLVVLIPLIALLWHAMPSEAKDYATDVSAQSATIHSRLVTIGDVMKAFRSSPWIGVGVGLRKQLEPHNVLVLTLGETGLLGLSAFIGMFIGGFYTFFLGIRAARSNPQARTVMIIGAAVLLLSLTHGLMDVYWRRGVGFMGWSCVGIAANVYFQRQKQWIIAPVRQCTPLADAS